MGKRLLVLTALLMATVAAIASSATAMAASAATTTLANTSPAQSRFEELLDMHQAGQLIPLYQAETPDPTFLCYGRLDPNQPIALNVNYENRVVQDFQAADQILSTAVANRIVPVQEGTVDGFNGTVMAGQSRRIKLASSTAKAPDLRADIFITLSIHQVSKRHLLAIFRKRQDDITTPNLCQLRQSVEFVCIEAESGI